MPPYPMMPFAVDAFLKLREEASAKFAELRGRLARRRTETTAPVEGVEVSADERPISMQRLPARRAA